MANTPSATPTFYDLFAANMRAMGMPAPRSLFETAPAATATIAALSSAMTQHPQRVTVREILLTIPAFASAGALAEGAVVVGGVTASLYVGACIGSLVVATGQSISLETLLAKANELHLRGPWLMPALTAAASRQHIRARR